VNHAPKNVTFWAKLLKKVSLFGPSESAVSIHAGRIAVLAGFVAVFSGPGGMENFLA
jgi:hypothetical protein